MEMELANAHRFNIDLRKDAEYKMRVRNDKHIDGLIKEVQDLKNANTELNT